MYRAAYGVFQNVHWHGKIAIVTGSGNNGGDGFALACILSRHGYTCSIFTLGKRLTEDGLFYAQQASDMGVRITPFDSGCVLSDYDIVVDCLLGTGFRGSVREDYRAAIRLLNDSGAFIVSVDINSGLNGDTGEADIAVMSDLTVAIGYIKNGLIASKARKYMKRLVCADIGIILIRKENLICTTEEWIALCESHGIKASASQVTHDGRTYYRCPDWLEL